MYSKPTAPLTLKIDCSDWEYHFSEWKQQKCITIMVDLLSKPIQRSTTTVYVAVYVCINTVVYQ